MTHQFKRFPHKNFLKRGSVSFGVAEVSNITFSDDVEIVIYSEPNVVYATHKLSGFVFLNSLEKRSNDRGDFFFIKLS